MKSRYLIGMARLMCFVAGMYTAFLLLSFFQTGEAMTLSFFPWLLWVVGVYLLNLLALKRGISLSALLAGNAAAWVLLSVCGNLYWMQVSGIAARIFGVVFYGVSIVIAEESARTGVRPNQTLVQTEVLLMLLGLLLLMEELGIAPGFYGKYCVLAAVVLNLFALILTRLMMENPVKVQGSRFQGGVLLGTLFLLLGLLGFGFAAAFSESGRRLLQILVERVKEILVFLWEQLNRFILFLISLFPAGEAEELELEAPMQLNGVDEAAVMKEIGGSNLLMVLGILLVLAAAAVFCYVLYRLRKVRIRQTSRTFEESGQLRREKRLGRWLRTWLGSLRRRLLFWWQSLCRRNSPQGLLLEAERYGRRNQMVREQRESPGAYLRRLARWERENREQCRADAMEEMALMLDRFFYSGREIPWTALQIRRWKQVFRESPEKGE